MDYLVLIKIHRIDEAVTQSLPLFPLCYIKFSRTINKECYLFSCKHGLVHFFLQNADFKLPLGFLQLVQPFLGRRCENPGLNSVEHIVSAFFVSTSFFSKEAGRRFSFLQFHKRINQPFLHQFK